MTKQASSTKFLTVPQTLLYGDPHAMTTEQLVACRLILGREILERSIAAAFPHIDDDWLAALDIIDGDENLEPDADAEDGADHEEEDEHGTELDNGEDELDCGDLEPNLGWPETCSQDADRAGLGPCGRMMLIASELFNVSTADLLQPGRSTRAVARARQIAMYVAHVALRMTMTDVARGFGRDRSTVSHACNVVEDMREDPAFDRMVANAECLAESVIAA